MEMLFSLMAGIKMCKMLLAILLYATCIGTCYSLPAEYTKRIVDLVASNPGQLSVKEYSLIAETLLQKQPCNMLVFGVGRDSQMWMDLNSEGTTVFLEDNEEWVQRIQNKTPLIKIYLVKYATKCSEWRELLNISDPNALRLDLPQVILDTPWDIIFVDAPAGYSDAMPGRMKSIYMASLLANQHHHVSDVFVHDCDRKVEALFCSKYLHDENLQGTVDKLRHYLIK